MNYPEWDESANDKILIEEFYSDILIRYPKLKESIEYNEGLLHVDMGDFQRFAEDLCKERKIDELNECFEWVNSLFCRSKNELLNAINVSFLECFEYKKGISKTEFEELMPKELYHGYLEMMKYMEKMDKDANDRVRALKTIDQTVEEKRPSTHFKECPECKNSIEYWWTSGMSECFPHFYCEICSNVIWRSSDRDVICSSKPSDKLAEIIVKELPQCQCGGSFKAGANPKCPSCHHVFKNNNSITQRLTDPNVILLQGAIFTSEN